MQVMNYDGTCQSSVIASIGLTGNGEASRWSTKNSGENRALFLDQLPDILGIKGETMLESLNDF